MSLRTSAVGLALALVLFPAGASAEDRPGALIVRGFAPETPTPPRSKTPPRGAPTEVPDEQDEEKPVLALAAGGAVSFVALGVGATIISESDNRIVRDAGLLGGQSAMVFAPLVAHAIVGEAKRGVWFSLPVLLPLAVNSVVVGFYPGVIRRAPAGIQYTTFIATTLSVFGATIGVLDAVRVGERKQKKSASSSSFTVLPMLGAGTAGAFVTGTL